MESKYNKVLLTGFLIFGIAIAAGALSLSFGATAGVLVGSSPTGIGFTDDATGVGNTSVPAHTAINVGDTVHWHYGDGFSHTVTTQAALGSLLPAPCGTGDSFDAVIQDPVFGGPIVFDHTFGAPGTCAYFCKIHGAPMQGDVTVGGVTTTTSTVTTSTAAGTTSTIPGATTTTPITTVTTVPSTIVTTTTTFIRGTTSVLNHK